MSHRPLPRRARGLALIVVLSVVLVMTLLVSFALQVSGTDRGEAGKGVKNTAMNTAIETSLQYSKAFFFARYTFWNTYLALDYSTLPDTLPAGFQDLRVPNIPTGYLCAIFARDDADELLGGNNPARDNNNRIFAGAVCKGPSGKIAEAQTPLDCVGGCGNNVYNAQASGGTQGINNAARTTF
jgi:hypothetical protein